MNRTQIVQTRAHPLVFGVVLFLSSEVMFFAGLFAAYYGLRGNLSPWPPSDVHLDVRESAIGTALLGISSATAFAMAYFLQRDDFRKARLCLGATIALAIVFLAIALHGWSKNTFGISSHVYGSLFYTMTGFHALHVLAGVFVLCALFFGIEMPAFQRDQRAGVEAISYYWHFVFVVWLGIWGSIYLIR